MRFHQKEKKKDDWPPSQIWPTIHRREGCFQGRHTTWERNQVFFIPPRNRDLPQQCLTGIKTKDSIPSCLRLAPDRLVRFLELAVYGEFLKTFRTLRVSRLTPVPTLPPLAKAQHEHAGRQPDLTPYYGRVVHQTPTSASTRIYDTALPCCCSQTQNHRFHRGLGIDTLRDLRRTRAYHLVTPGQGPPKQQQSPTSRRSLSRTSEQDPSRSCSKPGTRASCDSPGTPAHSGTLRPSAETGKQTGRRKKPKRSEACASIQSPRWDTTLLLEQQSEQ